MHAYVRCLAVAGIGAAFSISLVSASLAADSATSCAGLGVAQRSVLEHADQGVDALRRYVFITRSVYQISMADVVESLDEWRAKAQCKTPAAADATVRESTVLAKTR